MLLLLSLISCTPKPVEPAAPQPEAAVSSEATAGVDHPVLREVLETHWEATMRTWPTWATSLGDHRYDDQLADPSAEAIARVRADQATWAAAAARIPEAALTPDDRVTRALFVEGATSGVALAACRFELWSVSPRDNLLVELNFLPELHPHTPDATRDLLARYREVPSVADALVANLRAGLAEGIAPNATSTRLVIEMLDEQLERPSDEWPLLAVVHAERPDWTAAEREALDTELREAVESQVRPALARYRDLLRDEVLPVARGDEQPGIASLPLDGCYEALIREETSLPLEADALHRIGRDELERIHAELRVLGARALGTDDLQAIFERLRSDPELRFATSDEVEAKAEQALAAAAQAIPEWFGRLPEAEVVVAPVPPYEAPYTTIAYYRRPAPDGSRPGTYYVNTYAPETRPRFEAEVLAFHESIPGHHLQIAIAQELQALPAFRRHSGSTAFVEGWGLYSERLADEMGLYSGDLDRIGMLSFDTWRASRLVVDTGLHAKGWSRQQAIDFMRDNTPLAVNNIANEVDRYVTTPGQALAYKIGQREMLALRAEAEQALGARFDVRAFHDVVLGGGAVSLPVLRSRVEAWIASEAAE